MGLNPAIDITAAQRKTLLALLAKHLPNTAAWVYGSRAKWTSRPQSDLDMVVFAPPEQNGRVADLREAFEESNLPFRVDLFVWDSTPERFRKQIEAEHVVLVENGNQSAGAGRPTVTLGDCIEINDSTYSPKEAWPFVNYLDTGNITGNQISQIQHLIAEKDKIPSRARRKVRPGDIVYSTVRPNQRHFGILKQVPENFLASTGFSVIRGKDGFAHTDFIYWFLTQDQIVENLHTIAEHSTSAYPSIKPSDIERLQIQLPPLPEQRAIARILGTLDDKIGLNRRMNETLEAMARALFRSWFVDFDPVRAKMAGRDPALPSAIAALFPDRMVNSELGQIPEGWEVRPLGDMVEIIKGRSYRSHELTESTTALVTLKSFARGGGYRPEGLKSFTGAYKPNQVVQPGEVVIACTDVTQAADVIGRPAVVQETARYNTLVASLDTLIVRPVQSGMTKAFLYFLTSSNNFVAHTYAHTKGTTVLHLEKEAVPSFQFAYPTMQLIHCFDSIARPILDRISAIQRESGSLAALRDRLLPKLVSGELQARDISLPYGERSDG